MRANDDIKKNVHKTSNKRDTTLPVLKVSHIAMEVKGVSVFKHVTFTLNKGEIVVLVGPSGSGRTSILKALAGLDKITRGSIHFLTQKKPDQDLVTMVFDEPALFPWLTIEENMDLALQHLPISEKDREERIAETLDIVGLSGYEEEYPFELSRSLRMKASIARAFSLNPVVLLLDEPFGNLDALSRIALKEELLRVVSDETPTQGIVMTTNSIEDAVFMADKIVVLDPDKGMKSLINIDLERPRNLRSKKLEAYIDKVYGILLE